MTLRFHNGRIALPDGIVEAADIRVTDGRITAIDAPTALAAGDAIDLSGGWLLPGFVDTQVNGGGGVLFNDQTDVDAIAAIGAAHSSAERRVGKECVSKCRYRWSPLN